MAKNGKVKSMEMAADQIVNTNKDASQAIGRSPRYVQDLRRAGLELPTTVSQCRQFHLDHPRATRFRADRRRR